jgi:hypothetical protein
MYSSSFLNIIATHQHRTHQYTCLLIYSGVGTRTQESIVESIKRVRFFLFRWCKDHVQLSAMGNAASFTGRDSCTNGFL